MRRFLHQVLSLVVVWWRHLDASADSSDWPAAVSVAQSGQVPEQLSRTRLPPTTCEDMSICSLRVFLDGSERLVPKLRNTSAAMLRFALHYGPQIRPWREARATVYLVHVLSTLQIEVGATGNLASTLCMQDDSTHLLWEAVQQSQRLGEHIRRSSGSTACSYTGDWDAVQNTFDDNVGSRWLLLSGSQESAADVATRLTAAAKSLVPGGILALEGLNDLYKRPQVQEGFHMFMHASRNREGGLQPFLRIGLALLLAQPSYVEAYRGMLQAALPQHAFLRHHKFMYGGEILIPSYIEVLPSTLKSLYTLEDIPISQALWALGFLSQQLKSSG